MKVVFAGTAAFAGPTLDRLVEAGHQVAMVITQPDRPAGRGLRMLQSRIKLRAEEYRLPIFQPERIADPDAMRRTEEIAPNALVVVAYGQILPTSLLELPGFGAINLHASLLPRHRGPAPIAWAILKGDQETGVTVMQMDAGVDTGPILAQERVPIGPQEIAPRLEGTLSKMGAQLLVSTLERLERGEVTATPQPTEGATYAPRLRSEDGKLSVEMSAAEIDRRVRALSHAPGCWITLHGREVKVISGHLGDMTVDGLALDTCEGTYVIDEVLPPGGRRMSGAAWARGIR